MTVREWEGTAWQDFCVELLKIRYANHNLVEVPDTMAIWDWRRQLMMVRPSSATRPKNP